ncbi:hypothetical protein NFI96_013907 [Prochilodus magdalenae]|nr:hypothetical protein NFI96_013907 [Prochilodus magdalenae]
MHVKCLVQLLTFFGALTSSNGEQFPWYYIVAGIGGFVLLLIACSLAFEYRGKRLIDSYYVNSPKNQNKNKERTGHGNAVREDSDGHYEDMEGEMQPDDYENMHRDEHDGRHGDTERDESEGDYVNAEREPHEGQYIEPGGQHGHTGMPHNRRCLHVTIFCHSILTVFI